VIETLRVPEGDDVLASVAKLPDGAFVIGSGWLESAEVDIAVADGRESRALPGRVALLSLTGSKSGPLMAVVAHTGGELIGGELVRARSAGVSIAVVGAAEAAEVAGRAAVAAPNSWAAIAAIPQDDDETDEAPKYGDRVNHFVFGLCDVMLVRGERMKILDARGPGRLREIHLSAVKVLPPTVEDGKRVFKLAKRT
jgi:hypothetical protein